MRGVFPNGNKGCIKKGNIPWNKGRKHPAATKIPQLFVKGQIPWNKNQKEIKCVVCEIIFHVQPSRELTARYCSRGCKRKSLIGKKPWNWISDDHKNDVRRIRDSLEYREWRRHVYQRDDYTCQSCGMRGGKLHADHEMPFSMYPELRFEVLNGRTLCVPCHRTTPTWGSKVKKVEIINILE